MKFYEITDPRSGYIHVRGTNFESEGEIRKEWIEKCAPEHQEHLEPRDIKIREIKRHELGVPEQMDEHYTDEEMQEIYDHHRNQTK